MKKFLVMIGLSLVLVQAIAGTITTNTTSLSGFGNVYPFHSSTSLRYTVSGSALTANLIITADNGFEISTSYDYGYSQSVILTPVSGFITTQTIYVRFSPSATGAFTGNIVNSSNGSTPQNIAVNGTCIIWAIPTGYYSTVNTQTGAALKTVLYNKITGHTAVGYTPGVWNAFATTDVQLNGKVWDIYSTRLDTTPPYEFTLVTHQDNGTGGSTEGDKYNREHSFPQSWFGGSVAPMVSDVHHIFATDKKVNNQRGNYPFGVVTSPTFTSLIGGKLGTNTTAGYTGTAFEPVDEYKGDIARAQLYMITRYENLISGWQSNGNANDVLAGNTFPGYDSWYIDLLQSWHNLDPVSDKEVKRNNAIYALQNNRNPFIDSPQFVQRIWGGPLPAKPTIVAGNFSVTNLSNTGVTLNWTSGNGTRRIVLLKAGSAVNNFPIDTHYYQANANLSMAAQIGSGNYIVYNGTGSSVTLTNLVQGTNYHYAVVEYNGWYSTSNYQTTGILTSSATTLPVLFTSFIATNNHPSQVLLLWQTASEQNNKGFFVERSIDAHQWETIGWVNGAGNSKQTKNYQFADNLTNQPIHQSTIYYRLRQTDFDNRYNYSATVSVTVAKNSVLSALSKPNPFIDAVSIDFQTPVTGELFYIIQNLIGQTYVHRKMVLHNEQQLEISDLGMLPVGIYVLQLNHAGKTHHLKIIKQ